MSKREQIEVLVIDDEHGVRSVLAEALASDGYLVYLADGTNVIHALTARHYDLIITDLRMPVMDGLETLGVAKEKSPDAKLIVITGYPSEESLQLCNDLGVSRYLVKPFSISEIRQVAKNVLRRKIPVVR
jgi:two-component system response regulator (stage 0 sporulation protein F)